jgi:hypothetical protein
MPSIVTAAARFAAPAELLNQVRIGDQDDMLDERAAVVVGIGSRRAAGRTPAVDLAVRLGVDEDSDGRLRYRGRVLKAGVGLSLTTERYVLDGTVLSVDRDARGSK